MTNGKTILIITDNVPSQINGVVTTYSNIEPLAVNDGYTVKYINPDDFAYVDCPVYPEVKLTLPWNIAKKIQHIDPDYIHIATEGPLGMAARLWLNSKGFPYTSAYHTKYPEALKKIAHVPESLTWAVMRWFHRHSHRVLTTTVSMAQQLKSMGFNNHTVPWTRGTDRSVFKPVTHVTDRKNPVLLCVSRISAEKNLEDFFQLDYPGAVKIMVGDGPKLAEYQSKYPQVQFVGAKRSHELSAYYQTADVFVFPSRWDTFGLVMIEAMSCGTPVAAYPVQGPVDVINQNIDGVMHNDLAVAVEQCLMLDRNAVHRSSQRWSWQQAWLIFEQNLVPK
jgi:glycosyltransferase involved in cell wall biosynthesis